MASESRHFQFRFHPDSDDDNEIRALHWLEQQLDVGESLRSLMVRAILALAEMPVKRPPEHEALESLIAQAQSLVEKLQTIERAPISQAEKAQQGSAISGTFAANILSSIKPGKRKDE